MTHALPALAIAAAAPSLLAAATPAVWKSGIAGPEPRLYRRPHAMLKIRDSVYLGEGQSAVLVETASRKLALNNKPGAKAADGTLSRRQADRDAEQRACRQRADGKNRAHRPRCRCGEPSTQVARVSRLAIFVYNQQAPA
ncbi:MAG: hypothetical protein H6924_12605 [Alphaproteobacteria bacterium]|nr:hypothetical protein [Alphaproteobacteria bacterium]